MTPLVPCARRVVVFLLAGVGVGGGDSEDLWSQSGLAVETPSLVLIKKKKKKAQPQLSQTDKCKTVKSKSGAGGGRMEPRSPAAL